MPARPPARRVRKRRRLTPQQREQRREAQREYRRRYDAGRFTVAVEIDGAVSEMLIATAWLKQAEIYMDNLSTEDRKKIAKALSKMLAEAAKR